MILKWNSEFSSYTMLHYLQDLFSCNDHMFDDFDWSVTDYKNIGKGDRFFMVKVGSFGQTGILMSGTITSNPELGEDWSGRGREVYYVYYEPDVMIDPAAFPILTSDELQVAIPDFDWFKGHSGVVLNDEQAEKLEKLWQQYINTNKPLFAKANIRRNGQEKVFIG